MKRMIHRYLQTVLVSVVIAAAAASCRSRTAPTKVATANVLKRASGSILEPVGRPTLSFEENRGQTDSSVKFLARGPGYHLYLTAKEAVVVPGALYSTLNSIDQARAGSSAVRMEFIGASPSDVEGVGTSATQSHYFIGRNPDAWRTNVPNYSKVRYANVYPGIDVIYYGWRNQLEYDLLISPGADLGSVRLAIKGAEQVSLIDDSLIIRTAVSTIRQAKPTVYQEVNGKKKPIDAQYVLKEKDLVGFQVATYDRALPIIIDPVLEYASYLGGTGDDVGNSIALDSEGNIYMTGRTTSDDFPVVNALQPQRAGGRDAYLTKLSSDGSTVLFSTYFGGVLDENPLNIKLDESNNVYVLGHTASTDYPVVKPFQSTYAGGAFDVFLTKFSSDGSNILFSTYLGGSDVEQARGLAVDSAGHAYLTGNTSSSDFPIENALQPVLHGERDAFVAKFSPDGSRLVYSTYLGGSLLQNGQSIALDAIGNAYVTGVTSSTDFPVTADAFQPTYGGGLWDVFVSKIDAHGSRLLYSTYLGGSGDDDFAPNTIATSAANHAHRIAVDLDNNIYLTGDTNSPDFPLKNALQRRLRGDRDAFVTKFNSRGELAYSSYFGGSNFDTARAIAVDVAGNIYIAGSTSSSSDFPTLYSMQPFGGGTYDGFLAKMTITDTGGPLFFSTYIGGSQNDGLWEIQLRSAAGSSEQKVYVIGETASNDFPVTGDAIQPQYGGGPSDAVILRLAP